MEKKSTADFEISFHLHGAKQRRAHGKKKKQQQLVLKIKGAARKRQAERRESDWSGSEKRLREFKVMEKDERKY